MVSPGIVDPIKSLPETPRTSQHHGIKRLKEGSQLGPHYAERRQVSQTADIFFSNRLKKSDRFFLRLIAQLLILVELNQILIIITLFQLIWHQTEFRLMSTQSEKGK